MTKNEIIRKALMERISKCSAGDKLPGEVELCEEFSVSRMTVNKVITKLAEEGLVYRHKKVGTFVSGVKQSASPIHILIPYPGFMEELKTISSTYWRLINCLHTITFGKVVPVILVPISKTNDENDIDLSSLEIIKPGETVVCVGVWYRKTFPWLIQRQCKIIYINNQVAEDILGSADKFHCITLDARQAAADVVRYLKESGRRYPAFVSLSYNNKSTKLSHPFVDGWSRGMGLLYGGLNSERCQIKYYPEEESLDFLSGKIKNYIQNNKCDALFVSNADFLDPVWKAMNELGLKAPDNIALFSYQNEWQNVDYPAAYFNFSIFQIAREIFNTYNESNPQNKFICAEFHCLEYLNGNIGNGRSKSSVRKTESRNFALEMTHI